MNTLQAWPSKEAPTAPVLAQVSYTLDLRFPRRCVCVLFVVTQYLEEVQSHWQEVFDSNMDNQLIQALSGAAVDQSTTYRFTFDKCFDISNTKSPSSTFPYPIVFMDMSQTLANLLSTHPQLPLQGALGLSKSFQQLIHHNQIDIGFFGKGKSRALGSGSSKGFTKGK